MLCFVMTLIMFFGFRFLSGFFVYIVILSTIVGLTVGGFVCLQKGNWVHEFQSEQNEIDFKYMALGLWILAAILTLIVLFFIKEIGKAIGIIQLSF